MANPENLRPVRSAKEAREKGRAGGLRSGARRRELASLKEAARVVLSMDSVSPKSNKAMELMGLDPDERTNAAAITATMVMRATEGDVKAYEALSRNMALLDADAAAERDAPSGGPDAAAAPHFDLSAVIAPVYANASRYIEAGIQEIILKGGRGSAKSSYAYSKCLDKLIERPHAQWLCCRRYSNTLKNSCFANVLWAIAKRGMTYGKAHEAADFTVTTSPMEITYRATGQRIIFAGLDDPGKIKSITFADPDAKVEILVFEEYNQLKGESDARSVEQSVFRGDYSLEFKLFNPSPDDGDWANVEAGRKLAEWEGYLDSGGERPSAMVMHTTYLDVPKEFLGSRFFEMADGLKGINERAYRNEYLGEETGLTGRVFANVADVEVTEEDVASFKCMRVGVDWGFENDPFVWLRVAYDRKTRRIVVFDEFFNVRTLDEDNVAEAKRRLSDGNGQFDRSAPENEHRCDIADKKSIATWRSLGVNARGASKAVPVATGVKWLQARSRIDIDRRRCPFAYQEFTRYAALEDEDGRFMGYPDKDNHTIDAVRYALYDIINKKDEV